MSEKKPMTIEEAQRIATLRVELRKLEMEEEELKNLPTPPGHHLPSPKLERIERLKKELGEPAMSETAREQRAGSDGAAKFLKSVGLPELVHSLESGIVCLSWLLDAYVSQVAKKAAEDIANRFDLNDGAVEPVEPEIEAIILAAGKGN